MTDRAEETPPAAVRIGNRVLTIVEDVVYAGIAVLLTAGAAVLLVTAVGDLLRVRSEPASIVLLDVLDTLLLVFIFVELLFAVRATLAERRIVAEPFLLVGVIAAIKEIVVLATKAPEQYLDNGTRFARSMVELGILVVLVVTLAAASVLLRVKEEKPEE